jgi:hypothetical protein
MGTQVLEIVDVVAGFLLASAGGLILWHPRRWPRWPQRLRTEVQRRTGAVLLVSGTFLATLEFMVITGNARAIDVVVLPITGLVALAALVTVWMRWRAARSADAQPKVSSPAQGL